MGPSPAATTSTARAPGGSAAGGVPAELRRFYDQRLVWKGCGLRSFTCATLTVPEDYAHPSGRTLHLAVIKDQTVPHPQGSLIVNPGGPGGSGVDFVRGAAGGFAELLAHFALVSFDPRGVGRSDPIRCVSPSFLDTYLDEPPVPTTTVQRQAFIRQARTFADECYQRNHGYLGHVGTLDAARDMDVLRAALGDQRLTYYGASYGTYLGAKYAQLFPHRIRAMLLDGAVNPAQSTESADIQQAVGFDTDLHDFLTTCVTSGNCSLGSSVPAAERTLRGLLSRLTAQPLHVGSRVLGPGDFFNGLAAGFYDTSDWPELRIALRDVQQGNGAPLLVFADALSGRRSNGTYSNLVESNTAINCIDRPGPASVAAVRRAAARAAAKAPFFGAAIAWSSLPCVFWKVPPVEPAHPVHAPTAADPILVMGTTHDPATPYKQAVALTHQLGDARLVTLDGDGHTAFLRGDTCIDAAGDAYLTDLRLPAKGLTCH